MRRREFEGLTHGVLGAAERRCGGERPRERVGAAAGGVFRFGETADGRACGGREPGEDFWPCGGELGHERRLGSLLIVRERRETESE